MAEPAVDSLREQLRERGYLTHGIERWFALDPWSSRAFWVELAIVALKVAVIAALFGGVPALAIMLIRNAGTTPTEAALLFTGYATAELIIAFVVVAALALALKLRPAIVIDTPTALLAISMLAAAILLVPLAIWWSHFDAPPGTTEVVLAAILGGIFFIVTTIVVSAAMLSFSIYELQRIPVLPRRPRRAAIAFGAVLVGVILAASAFSGEHHEPVSDGMITVRPSQWRVALVAVDGLTAEIFRSRADLRASLPFATAARPVAALSAAERWASIGTGVAAEVHGVRSIDGVRVVGSPRVLQRVSRADVVLRDAGPLLGLTRREPLPPTARRREYVWEVVARRGMTAAAVNWWATSDTTSGALSVTGPESIFARSGGNPIAVDEAAIRRTVRLVDLRRPQLVAVYLPALDVVLNRRALDRSQQLALSLRALDGVRETIAGLRGRGYDVLLAGFPGDGQEGEGIMAASFRIAAPASAADVAPTVADLLGFPLSEEMAGRSLTGMPQHQRVVSYGARAAGDSSPAVNQEYYESLKSLGYIQ